MDNMNIMVDEIYSAIVNYFKQELGYTQREAESYFVVEYDDIKVEVRCELGYDDMVDLSFILNDIVDRYAPGAYFDFDAPGIMSAYIV